MTPAQKLAAVSVMTAERLKSVYAQDSEGQGVTPDNSILSRLSYQASQVNQSLLNLVERVEQGLTSGTERVQLAAVSDTIAAKIQELTGVDARGYKVAIEARQIKHILNDHGENGISDHSMANPSDIAKMEYALQNPDFITAAGTAQAYVTNNGGKMKPANTVLYEKQNGDGSYYVVQAVPDTKKERCIL